MPRTKRKDPGAALAVNGGSKAVPQIEGVSKPKVGAEEFMALADTWGYGPSTRKKIRQAILGEKRTIDPHLTRYYNPSPSRVTALEAEARKLFGVKHCLAVNSGTSALTAAYVAAGIGPGDEVIVPAYTFFATVAAVIAAKAIPVIADIDDTLTLDSGDVEAKLTPRTKAIVPVHMVGCCADMGRIVKLARKHKLLVIEDCAQACGGSYKGRMLGSIGDLGCFSISSYKIIGAGEGGLVLTDDEWLYIRAQNQHDTAACWRPDRYARERKAGELFCGQNYRMSELEGTVNLVQMKKMPARVRRYRAVSRRIINALGKFPETRVRPSNDPDGDVGHRVILLAADAKKASGLVQALRAEGVPCSGRGDKAARDWHLYSYWDHIIEQKSATPEGCPFTCPYRKAPLPDYAPDMCPRATDLLSRAVFVNVSPGWTARDCRRVAAAIDKVCSALG